MNLQVEYIKYLIKDKLEDIQIWYTHTILYPYWDVIDGIRNYWTYRKIIYNDRWYDYSYILTLLEFKLQDTINQWDKSHYVGSNFTKLRMIIILNRLKEYDNDLNWLHEQYYSGLITKQQYNLSKQQLLNKTWNCLGRNITRFWD